MKWKSKLGLSLVAATILAVLVLFNNCQPAPVEQAPGASSGNNNGGGGGTVLSGGESYYNNTLKPLFTARCASCHSGAAPTFCNGLPVFNCIGPTWVMNYAQTKNKVKNGPNSNSNLLLDNMRGVGHIQNMCVGDTLGTNTPCKEAKTWIELEYPLLADGIAGNLDSISLIGQVKGWALDPRSPATKLNVIVYIGGPVGQGTNAGTYVANLAGSGQAQNGHYFNFIVPEQFRDGVSRSLYIYGGSAVADNLLNGSPQNFRAYKMSAAGEAYFTSTVAPAMRAPNKCSRCHTVAYDLQFYSLLTPTPAEGGSATNNLLVRKGSNQTNHSGGNVCGGQNGSPCAEFQEWWRREFGN